jgi:hypothetical protein
MADGETTREFSHTQLRQGYAEQGEQRDVTAKYTKYTNVKETHTGQKYSRELA